jgi:hypothetical protein
MVHTHLPTHSSIDPKIATTSTSTSAAATTAHATPDGGQQQQQQREDQESLPDREAYRVRVEDLPGVQPAWALPPMYSGYLPVADQEAAAISGSGDNMNGACARVVRGCKRFLVQPIRFFQTRPVPAIHCDTHVSHEHNEPGTAFKTTTGAHLFFWMHESESSPHDPLVIWLNGGTSGTSFAALLLLPACDDEDEEFRSAHQCTQQAPAVPPSWACSWKTGPSGSPPSTTACTTPAAPAPPPPRTISALRLPKLPRQAPSRRCRSWSATSTAGTGTTTFFTSNSPPRVRFGRGCCVWEWECWLRFQDPHSNGWSHPHARRALTQPDFPTEATTSSPRRKRACHGIFTAFFATSLRYWTVDGWMCWSAGGRTYIMSIPTLMFFL